MILNNIRNYLNNKSYNINISKNQLYINNYNKIDNINDKNISIIFEDFKLYIEGLNIKVIKMIDKEILFNGLIESIKIIPIQ
ncbi:MAG: hypothetical protein E7171_05175 [Firmicutes bacterium]|nr:hypothetical protein [Bacillota bacterium]